MTEIPGMDQVMAAVQMLHGGERERARAEMLGLWDRLGTHDAPLERCTLAHFLADTEEEVSAELTWDLRALAAATGNRGEQDGDALSPQLASFLPSLHLNVGDALRRAGDAEKALHHARIGCTRVDALPGDGYGATIRAGLERLRANLEDDARNDG
jgi:hypothetical protein